MRWRCYWRSTILRSSNPPDITTNTGDNFSFYSQAGVLIRVINGASALFPITRRVPGGSIMERVVGQCLRLDSDWFNVTCNGIQFPRRHPSSGTSCPVKLVFNSGLFAVLSLLTLIVRLWHAVRLRMSTEVETTACGSPHTEREDGLTKSRR